MPKTPSVLPTKRIPKSASAPAATLAAAVPEAPTEKTRPAPAAKSRARPAAAAPEATPMGADKPAKAHKPKLVRDSFTIPKDEYAVLDALKRRALGLEHHVRKSELLRAGIQVLAAMNDKALLKAIGAVPTLKTGRPKVG